MGWPQTVHVLQYCPSFTTEVVLFFVALVAKPRVASQYHFNEKPQMTWYHTMSTQPLLATPRWEFVVHMNSTKVLQMNSTKVVHTNSAKLSSTHE